MELIKEECFIYSFDEKIKTSIIFIGWIGSKLKHMKKYCEKYQQFGFDLKKKKEKETNQKKKWKNKT